MALDPNGLFTAPALKYRSVSGDIGAPADIKPAEVVFNAADETFYVGVGTAPNGLASEVKAFAKCDFDSESLLPIGGATGEVLTKNSNADFDASWSAIPNPTNIHGGFF